MEIGSPSYVYISCGASPTLPNREWRRSSAASEDASLLRSRRSVRSSHTNHAAALRSIRSNRSRRTKGATFGRGLALAECGRMTLDEYQLLRFPGRMCSIRRSNRRRPASFGPKDIPCSTTHTPHRALSLQVRTRRHIRAPHHAACLGTHPSRVAVSRRFTLCPDIHRSMRTLTAPRRSRHQPTTSSSSSSSSSSQRRGARNWGSCCKRLCRKLVPERGIPMIKIGEAIASSATVGCTS